MSDRQYGYVKLSRKAYAEDPFWNEKRVYSRWEAWEDIIQQAAYRSWNRIVDDDIVILDRGEFCASLRYMAARWGWSMKKVRGFVQKLEGMDRIRAQQRAHCGTVYVLVNYDRYQGGTPSKGTAKGTQRAKRGQNGGTKKKQLSMSVRHNSGSPEPTNDNSRVKF